MKKLSRILVLLLLTTLSIPAHGHSGEAHKWDGKKTPSVKLIVSKDAMSGYNVRIITKNFKWSPEHASSTHIPGEGHAHIYVDDVKIGRVYGEWYHLATVNLNLIPGSHTIRVDLNGNDHSPYMFNNALLEAKKIIKI